MKRASSLPILLQVAALSVLSVLLSQAVAFAVIVMSPDPRPPGFSIGEAAAGLRGGDARTTDGRAVRRRVDARPVSPRSFDPEGRPDPMAAAIAAALAGRLGVDRSRVRVVVDHNVFPFPRLPLDRRAGSGESFVFLRTERLPTPEPPVGRIMTPGEPGRAIAIDPTSSRFSVEADRLAFAPFSASLELEGGLWATVEPPPGLLSPWQQRILLGLFISLLLLAPIVWLLARRLTRPIRVFAEAAERLGADPDAEPLTPSGPSEVRTAIAAFNDMQGKLRAHMRQRTQTVAAIAHDLRTPLTRLRFRAEQVTDAVRERMAADIEEMDALIAQAMAFVRGEATPERRERLDLCALARDCVAGYAETGAAVTMDACRPTWVEADPATVKRALGNLIGNALKYAGSTRVTAGAADGLAVIQVHDEGSGLPPDELEAVFEPFRRGEASRSRETGGAGLGLTIARQAARAHGGDVTLQARPSGGLTATLTLPLAG